MTDGIRRKQQTSMPIANRRNTKKNTTRGIGYPRIETSRAGRYFLSAKLERMQEKIIGRDGRTVLTWREDSAAVICLHRKPDNRKRKENKHGLLP